MVVRNKPEHNNPGNGKQAGNIKLILDRLRGYVARTTRKKRLLMNSFDFERQGSTKYRRLVSLETRIIVPIQIVGQTGMDLI